MNIRTQPSEQQLAALDILKVRLAEQGYLIATVAASRRRHESDFVILPKDRLQEFAIVRAASRFVVIRPFGMKRSDLLRALPRLRQVSPAPLMYAMPQLQYVKDRSDLWRHFVEKTEHDEIETLQLRSVA